MVNVPWCHDCDNPLGLCSCEADPDQDLRDYHHGVVAELQKTIAAKDAAIERLLAERDEARRALRPFADLANDYMTDTVNIEDDVIIAGRTPRRGEEGTPPRVTFGDFRRAHLVDKIARARQALQDSAASGEQ